MAREASITQEEVNAVADRLRATGVKPTARGVREALGGGSMATVLKYLQVWQSGQVRQAETPTVMPAGLQKALLDFIGQEVASAKVALETDLVASQQANGDLIVESERQASVIDSQEQEIEVLHEEKAELSGRFSQLTTDLDSAKKEAEEQRQAAEAARTEQAKLQLRLEGLPRLEAEIEKLRAALETERNARVASDQLAAVAAAKLEKTEAQVVDLQTRLTKAEGATREADQTADKLRGQLVTVEGMLETTRKEGEQLKTTLTKTEGEKAQLQDEVSQLRLAMAPSNPTA